MINLAVGSTNSPNPWIMWTLVALAITALGVWLGGWKGAVKAWAIVFGVLALGWFLSLESNPNEICRPSVERAIVCVDP